MIFYFSYAFGAGLTEGFVGDKGLSFGDIFSFSFGFVIVVVSDIVLFN